MMSCKVHLKNYLSIAAICLFLWYFLEKELLQMVERKERLFVLVGTHGGYGYYLTVASVFVFLYLVFLRDMVQPFSVYGVISGGRSRHMFFCFKQLLFHSVLYSCIYVLVQILGVAVLVEWKQLVQSHFFIVMILYIISLILIFTFTGVCYLGIYILTKQVVLSMIITVAIQMTLAFWGKTGLLYGGITIVDVIPTRIGIYEVVWFLNRIMDGCIIGFLYIFIKCIYEKKDIL